MTIIHIGTMADKDQRDFRVVAKAGYKPYLYVDGKGGYSEEEYQGPVIDYCLYETHHGLCISDFERNGYDDSDWYMIVWNPTKCEPETIEFASTRGWSYPCYGSSPDATEATMKAYQQYQDGKERLAVFAQTKAKIAKLCEIRAIAKLVAKQANVPTGRVLKMRRALGSENFEAVANLFIKNIRSGFKLNLKAQVVAWLGEASPKYPTPLSRKQLEYI